MSAARARADASARDELVARVRALLVGEVEESGVREVAMFGGRSIMVRDKMLCCAMKSGDLLVRVDPADPSLREVPGASPVEMGAGRVMGPGWLGVAATSIADDDRLRYWLQACLARRRALGDSPS